MQSSCGQEVYLGLCYPVPFLWLRQLTWLSLGKHQGLGLVRRFLQQQKQNKHPHYIHI